MLHLYFYRGDALYIRTRLSHTAVSYPYVPRKPLLELHKNDDSQHSYHPSQPIHAPYLHQYCLYQYQPGTNALPYHRNTDDQRNHRHLYQQRLYCLAQKMPPLWTKAHHLTEHRRYTLHYQHRHRSPWFHHLHLDWCHNHHQKQAPFFLQFLRGSE